MDELTYKATQSFDKYIYELLLEARNKGYTIEDLISIYERTHNIDNHISNKQP